MLFSVKCCIAVGSYLIFRGIFGNLDLPSYFYGLILMFLFSCIDDMNK
jgi:hypothetical protein